MIKVYSATRAVNLETALDRNTRTYDKRKVPANAFPRGIYIYAGGELSEWKDMLVHAVVHDILEGHEIAVMSGLTDESQVKPDESGGSRIGMTLKVGKVYMIRLNEAKPCFDFDDVTVKYFD